MAPGSGARAARNRTTATLVQYRVPVIISPNLAIFVVYGEWVNLAIVNAWHYGSMNIHTVPMATYIVVSLSSDKFTFG